MKYKLLRVHYMPKVLEEGVLYVSEEFDTAAHLCACGCGSKIRTPLGPTEWAFEETPVGPTLHPSIGNWQQACMSHYWIRQGTVIWSNQWTPEEIVAGRYAEELRRKTYYDTMNRQTDRLWRKIWNWIKRLFNK
jgi:hypothetical protein